MHIGHYNKGKAARGRTTCDIRGNFAGVEVTDKGAIRLLFAAVAMQAVEDIRIWQERGLLAGRKIVVNLAQLRRRCRMPDGEKINSGEIERTVDWLASGAAQRFLTRAEIPYQLPRVV
jgi:hypothetical protein